MCVWGYDACDDLAKGTSEIEHNDRVRLGVWMKRKWQWWGRAGEK